MTEERARDGHRAYLHDTRLLQYRCARVQRRAGRAHIVHQDDAVLDAIGIRHADMPLTPAHVWRAMQGRALRTDLAIG